MQGIVSGYCPHAHHGEGGKPGIGLLKRKLTGYEAVIQMPISGRKTAFQSNPISMESEVFLICLHSIIDQILECCIPEPIQEAAEGSYDCEPIMGWIVHKCFFSMKTRGSGTQAIFHENLLGGQQHYLTGCPLKCMVPRFHAAV